MGLFFLVFVFCLFIYFPVPVSGTTAGWSLPLSLACQRSIGGFFFVFGVFMGFYKARGLVLSLDPVFDCIYTIS